MKTATIKDIARELGVAVSTVSRALQNHPDISEPTKHLVRECAKRLNYKPNLMASNLRTSKNNTIGVMVPELNHHFFASILDGIEQVANEHGYTILICQSRENTHKEQQDLETLLHSRVAGMLLAISKETAQLQHLHEVLDSNVPLVLYDRPCPSVPCDQVVCDDYAGAFAAVDHMVKTGCRRIMYFSSPMQLEVAHRRYQGWRDALTQHNLFCGAENIVTCDTREQAIQLLPEIMQSDNRPDAIFCVNDHCASGVLFAAQKLGIKVPDELSICGFSDAPLATMTSPMLSTVGQDGAEIGRRAMQRLLERLNGDTSNSHTEMVTTSLILRGTTR